MTNKSPVVTPRHAPLQGFPGLASPGNRVHASLVQYWRIEGCSGVVTRRIKRICLVEIHFLLSGALHS
jgi:hypothetical protein